MPSPIKILAVMQVTQIFFNATAGSMWIVYAYGVIGITATQWGLTSGISGLTRFAVSFNAGKLMDKYGRRKFLVPILFIIPLYPIAFTMVKDWTGLAALVIAMALTNAFCIAGFQSLLSDHTPRDRRGRVTSTVGTGSFFLDIRGTTGGGGMLLFIPVALGQAIGGTLYMQNPVLPFYVCAAGMAIVAVWGFLKITDPKAIEK
jgi:MFS family permease